MIITCPNCGTHVQPENAVMVDVPLTDSEKRGLRLASAGYLEKVGVVWVHAGITPPTLTPYNHASTKVINRLTSLRLLRSTSTPKHERREITEKGSIRLLGRNEPIAAPPKAALTNPQRELLLDLYQAPRDILQCHPETMKALIERGYATKDLRGQLIYLTDEGNVKARKIQGY